MDKEIKQDLNNVYEEIMWLAKRPKITPSIARAWYTHLTAERLKRKIRFFTGLVSQDSIDNLDQDLRLEHYKRIQKTLTELVENHLKKNKNNSEETAC